MGLRKHVQWLATAHREADRLRPLDLLSRPTNKTLPDSGRLRSYLYEQGWPASVDTKRPVDRFGEPLPWMTYPAIEFLSHRVPDDVAVFEYGAGYSTLWWRKRSKSVVSCEHDATWASEIKSLAAAATILVRSLDDGSYVAEIKKHLGAFDVIVIDGRERVACAGNAVPALRPRGIIIWDNSDRDEYAAGYAHLADNGFRRIDFHGMGPVNPYGWCTSVFYRDGNCLGL